MAYTGIDDSSAFFQCTLYTGNGSNRSITNTGHSDLQPDLIWIKSRSEGEQHSWTDVIRGTDSQIHSEGTNAQSTATNSVTAFGSGFLTTGLGFGVLAPKMFANGEEASFLGAGGFTTGVAVFLTTGAAVFLTTGAAFLTTGAAAFLTTGAACLATGAVKQE